MTLTVDRMALAPDLSISRVLTGLWQIADMERDGRAARSGGHVASASRLRRGGLHLLRHGRSLRVGRDRGGPSPRRIGRCASGAAVHEVGTEAGTPDARRRACGGRAIAAAASHGPDRSAAVPCLELCGSELDRRPAEFASAQVRGTDRAHRPDERGRGASQHGARYRPRGDFQSGLLLAARSARGRSAVGRLPRPRRKAPCIRNAGRRLVVESMARSARARLGTQRHLVAEEVRPLPARRRRVGSPAAGAARRGCGGTSTRRVDRQRGFSLRPRRSRPWQGSSSGPGPASESTLPTTFASFPSR